MKLSHLRPTWRALIIVGALGASPHAHAIPAFARQLDVACSTCHSAFPRLNEAGRTFRSNGYRMLEEAKGLEAWQLDSLPLAFEAEMEAFRDRDTDSESVRLPTASDVKLEAAEVLFGTALGETGRASVFAAIEVAQEDENGETTYAAELGPAFIQVNDLAGGQGLGRLNFRVGQFDLSMPFLSPEQSVIKNDYLAQAIGALGDGARRALEINGQAIVDSGDNSIAHRYAFGLARTAFNGDSNRSSDFDPYASYAVNFRERYTLGLIAKSDHEEGATPDESQKVRRVGIAGNAVVGPAEVTLGYFSANPDLGATYDDTVLEGLYYIGKKTVLGARLEQLSADGATDDARAISFTTRYNVLQNLAFIFEYRHLKDNSSIIGDNIEEEHMRLIFQLLL